MRGISVCFTGFRDADLEKAIENRGGEIKSSVVKKLTYLITKGVEKSGKTDKAESYGIEIITKDDFIKKFGL